MEVSSKCFPLRSVVSAQTGALTANGPVRLNSFTSVLCWEIANRGSMDKHKKAAFFIFDKFVLVFQNAKIKKIYSVLKAFRDGVIFFINFLQTDYAEL